MTLDEGDGLMVAVEDGGGAAGTRSSRVKEATEGDGDGSATDFLLFVGRASCEVIRGDRRSEG